MKVSRFVVPGLAFVSITEQGIDFGRGTYVNGDPLPMFVAKGHNFVQGTSGQIYEALIINLSGKRMLVQMSIDGTSIFDGQPTNPLTNGGRVIEPGDKSTIIGYKQNSKTVSRFVFSAQASNTVAVQMGSSPKKLGTIEFAFFTEEPRRPQPQWDEGYYGASGPWRGTPKGSPQTLSLGGDEGSGLEMYSMRGDDKPRGMGTGMGDDAVQHTISVPFEQSTVKPLDTLTIYVQPWIWLLENGILVDDSDLDLPDSRYDNEPPRNFPRIKRI